MTAPTVDPIVRTFIKQRRALGLTQRQVAKRAGVQNTSIANWERGTDRPRLDSLRRWAAGLNIGIKLTGVLPDSDELDLLVLLERVRDVHQPLPELTSIQRDSIYERLHDRGWTRTSIRARLRLGTQTARQIEERLGIAA